MKKLFRACFIAWTALRYGLDEMALSCLPRPWLRALGRLTRRGRRLTAPRGQRLRMALERLGPIFVKFGQVLSTRRDLLPGQITRTDADGSLLVTATIHHPQQLLPIVRYWMPHVRILEPQEWEEQLIHSVQETLRQWLPETRTKTRPEKPSKTRAGKKAGKTVEKQTAKQAKEQP